jgi:hypothetical protein|tara:strand:+ start:122 stop:499 length:378 start_codon:yes stop_codon:yes gene_type:complete
MALPEKKQEALRLLTAGHSMATTAEKVGVTRSAIWKWTKEPEFSAEMTVYKDKKAAGAQLALSYAVYEAVEVLRAVMSNEDSSAKERTDAAKIVLDRAKLELQGSKVKVKGGTDAMEQWLSGQDE